MAFIVQLREGSEDPINLFYVADDGWAMIEKGLQPNDPERHELWGGQLENVLVRLQDGRREIPLRFQGEWSTVDAMIDAVNALEKRLRHAARYRADGWGDEVFLRVQLHNASYPVDFPVSSGSIDKNDLMNACSAIMDATGHREAKRLTSVGVTIVCGEPYWESTESYYLDNLVYNPGFWRGAVAPGDSWTEVDPAAGLTLAWETTIIQFMGRSLKWTIAPDAVNDVGIRSDNIAVSASTSYYVEGRGYHTAGCDRITMIIYDVTGAAPIGGAVWLWDNADDDWEKIGGSFTTPVGCANVRIDVYRDNADSTAGNKTFYCDAFYLGLGRRGDGLQAPLGWMSGGNLTNELDAADQINVICVAELPGEVDAETRIHLEMPNQCDQIRIAKRIREDSHNFIWELLGVNAVVTAGDAACKDSVLVPDVNAPGGQRVDVSFAGTQGYDLRCYWQITSDLASYYGKFVIALMARASGGTDTIKVGIKAYQDDTLWRHGGAIKVLADISAGASFWNYMDGWELFAFPVGAHQGDNWDIGNQWVIEVWAETDAGAPVDSLQIAGAYLVSADEANIVAVAFTFAANTHFDIQDLDGDRGAFPYSAATNRYYSDAGIVGVFPQLTPRIENWLYLSWGSQIVITHATTASIRYRPRGIFLRGTNP